MLWWLLSNVPAMIVGAAAVLTYQYVTTSLPFRLLRIAMSMNTGGTMAGLRMLKSVVQHSIITSARLTDASDLAQRQEYAEWNPRTRPDQINRTIDLSELDEQQLNELRMPPPPSFDNTYTVVFDTTKQSGSDDAIVEEHPKIDHDKQA